MDWSFLHRSRRDFFYKIAALGFGQFVPPSMFSYIFAEPKTDSLGFFITPKMIEEEEWHMIRRMIHVLHISAQHYNIKRTIVKVLQPGDPRLEDLNAHL